MKLYQHTFGTFSGRFFARASELAALFSVKATEKIFEKAPPAVRKLRKQATSELRRVARKVWQAQHGTKKP